MIFLAFLAAVSEVAFGLWGGVALNEWIVGPQVCDQYSCHATYVPWWLVPMDIGLVLTGICVVFGTIVIFSEFE